jgi:hypothetical protein
MPNNEEFKTRIHDLPHSRILEMLDNPNDYTPEALAYAKAEIELRGGREKMMQEEHDKEQASPTDDFPVGRSVGLGKRFFWSFLFLVFGYSIIQS